MSVTMRNVAHRAGVYIKTVSRVMSAGVDCMTVGAMRALYQHGLHIPHDAATIGFDDVPSALYFTPPLTTIYPSIYNLRRIDLRLLTDRINNRPIPPTSSRLPPKLVIHSPGSVPVLAGPLA